MSDPRAEAELDRIIGKVRAKLPVGTITVAHLDAFLVEYRPALLGMMTKRLARAAASQMEPPDLWTANRRTAANLAAMAALGGLISRGFPKRKPSIPDEVRRELGAYSGWGGLSIEANIPRFPVGVPVPDARGLIHEYYTPTKVASEVARVLRPLLPGIEDENGRIPALEPSAGIGRFVRQLAGDGFEAIDWNAIEFSELSGMMLQAMRPEIDVFLGSFERWVTERGPALDGKLRLVVANPPYGVRGASIADDPVRSYRDKGNKAYVYFMRRALDLLGANGIGVFLVPSGFMTGKTPALRAVREAILRRHHLSTAYRLPSKLFPGALLVTDLLFFRSRGGELPTVDPADAFIAEGRYFAENPAHILGTEVGKPGEDDDQSKTPRWGYQVEGEFTSLPPLVERSVCSDCTVVHREAAAGRARQGGVGRRIEDAAAGLPSHLASAVSLGIRVDTFLTAVAAQETRLPKLAWKELNRDLAAWKAANGNPWADRELRRLSDGGNVALERFLTAWEKGGNLSSALTKEPVYVATFTGRAGDVPAMAEWLYRQHRSLDSATLRTRLPKGVKLETAMATLFAAGWCLDGDDNLMPGEDYVSGALWPRYDRAKVLADAGDEQARIQCQRLLTAIKPAVYDEIDGLSPRAPWLPLDLVTEWVNSAINEYRDPVEFELHEGLLRLRGVDYDTTEAHVSGGYGAPAVGVAWFLGWYNHDKTLWTPPYNRSRTSDDTQDLGRLRQAAEWDTKFKAWVGALESRRLTVEKAYQRLFQGFVTPQHSSEPLELARWVQADGARAIRLNAHQNGGARRCLANRGGLIAFDVGVGKTYTGLAVLAGARQEGWAKRPALLVPNSIVWKWYADIQRVLPDYRVGVVGSRKKTITRGPRKGFETSETDSPEERAATWTRFQAGEFDCVLITYSVFHRSRLNEGPIREYAAHHAAIQREVALTQRNLEASGKELTERQQAIVREGVGAWIAEKLEMGEDERPDPGIAWDDLGIDFLMVDEAQNFKNLYLPEAREGGVPRFMGNAGEGSNRAWQLDFRAASVRRRTGGAGVVLLSATPAKNSPLEFYNLIQYVDQDAWTRMGISNPEQFIDRYCRIEVREVLGASLDVVTRSAVVGFTNLHELRHVIFRYGEFKTSEQANLKLPRRNVPPMVEVAMNAAQERKYSQYVARIEEIMSSGGKSEEGSAILGLLARMSLVAIHEDLDEGYDWSTAAKYEGNVASPKFAACAERVLQLRNCGHIIFCDNLAAHRWMQMTLIQAGIPEERIGILNAKVAKAAADRQRIAQMFNGNPDEGVLPAYDVVICNQIAYEGIDLQTRTCSIHHLDLPWEPATLQQRNGRGVRQGNREPVINIYYYFSQRSSDGQRYSLIQGKHGWMVEVLESQNRDTNNPGAQMALGPEEYLLLISRDPEKTRQKIAQVEARREAERREKLDILATSSLRAVVTRFAKAKAEKDPVEAARIRGEAEIKLDDLARVDPLAWPWALWAYAARDHRMLVVDKGPPLYETLMIAKPSALDAARIEYAQFGKVTDTSIGMRLANQHTWSAVGEDRIRPMGIEATHRTEAWPEDDEQAVHKAVEAALAVGTGYYGRRTSPTSWATLGWAWAPDAWLAPMWATYGAQLLVEWRAAPSYEADTMYVPVIAKGRLHIGRPLGYRQAGLAAILNLQDADEVIPPTEAGWARFLAVAGDQEHRPTGNIGYTNLNAMARWWWLRSFPPKLLAQLRGEKDDDQAEAAK